nr:hypothetical protein OH826_19835 [Streptomyces sp. NBC_00899]
MVVDESNAQSGDLQWAYVLHPIGIEVIPLTHARQGAVVGWDCDPLISFSDEPQWWSRSVRVDPPDQHIAPPSLTVTRPAPAAPPSEHHTARR